MITLASILSEVFFAGLRRGNTNVLHPFIQVPTGLESRKSRNFEGSESP